ncbi:DUF3566 domain-containing protein [Phytohabitans sp. ZYX-F-186]|uniref:DUF3566 domain-containing protein n=1 Tax=Phytohabitans maris TaxID=3071409 RepID=A0ABU0ZIY7_9ACTN|nr:DUF3566 domain-containing protein [Phytohabitans sp. ZYX-F-186]MDQ7907016.1 DUF3566 domain-containing protein [Phytohabitans sp. ZYX-F-186]
MTETQAKSGAAGTSTNPVEGEAAPSGTPATGRAVVGRAAVPAEAPSPKFTRAPGMPPPPDQPPADGSKQPPGAPGAAPPVAAGKAPVSSPPAGATQVTPGAAPGGPAMPPGVGARPGTGRAAAGGASVRTVGAAGATGAAAVGAARVGEAVRAARSTVASAASRGPRRAKLNVKRIDPWSVMKFSFAVSLVLFIVVIVATSVLYLALDAMGVFESVNSSLTDLVSAGGGENASTFRITAKGVIGTSALIGAVNVVLFTALATLGAFIYNVCADLVGGIELTLAERD